MNRVAFMISNRVIPKSVVGGAFRSEYDSRVGFSPGRGCCTLEKTSENGDDNDMTIKF